jgi:hypothetical protein
MPDDLHSAVLDDLKARKTWEDRQALWYQMRHHGIPRRSKPYPGAPDLHFPLADTHIEKLKPFYFQQLFAQEQVAFFISKDPNKAADAGTAAAWFDYKLKQESNLEDEILIAIDQMLMSGRCNVKVFWDPAKKRLRFDALSAVACIVPDSTQDVQDGDRFVQVISLSVDQYKRRGVYKADEETIKAISGKGTTEPEIDAERYTREGITHSDDKNQIVLWESYTRDNDKWKVETLCPVAPKIAIRAAFALPYKHGKLPFVSFQCERKEKGYYQSRGIPEIVAPFEASLCKLWNQKHEFMDFANRPLFRAEKEIPNTGAIRTMPGTVLPYGIVPAQMTTPPIGIDQEMSAIRMVSEYRVGMPDFGVGSAQAIGGKDNKTAAEVNALTGLLNVSVDLKGRMFRKSLQELFRQAWALLCQYDCQGLDYCAADKWEKATAAALREDAYSIMPTGSADGWNKGAQLQKAIARKQLLGQSPFINQAELDRSIVELDDPRLVSKFFVDPRQKQADEYEDEAEKIPAILRGAPLRVRPEMDNFVRLKCLMDFIQQQGALGVPPQPVELLGLQNRIQAHLLALQQKNPGLARQVAKQIEAITQPQQQQQMQPQGGPR